MKIKKFLLFACTLLALTICAQTTHAEFFSDIIVTSPDALWTDSRAYSTLQDAIDAVGSDERTIVVAKTEVCTDLTIPSNVHLKFLRGGSIANSGQLTINTTDIDAGNYQIFTGAGDIDFASGSVIKSSWFSSLQSALSLTSDDTLTLTIDKAATITTNSSVGNDVTLKWPSPNIITVDAGSTLSNIKNVIAGDYQIFAGSGDFDFASGATLNSAWFEYLKTAMDYIGSDSVNLVVSTTEPLDADRTVNANTNLTVSNGGLIAPDSGVTLTINGPFSAGLYQVFSGDGDVSFGNGAVKEAYPEWWGAKADGVTNCSSAIQKALDSNIDSISFAQGTYIIDVTLQMLIKNKDLHGGSISGTILQAIDNSIGSIISIGDIEGDYIEKIRIRDMSIVGNGCDYGIYGYMPYGMLSYLQISGTSIAGVALQGWCNTIDNCIIQYNNGDGIQTIGSSSYSNNLVVRDSKISNNEGFGFDGLAANTNQVFTGTLFEGNKKGGIYCWSGDYHVTECYFEGNAEVGHHFTSPTNLNIKADIIHNGSSSSNSIQGAYPGVLTVISNYSTPTYLDYFIYVPGSGKGLVVESNNLHDAVPLVGIYGDTDANPSYGTLNNARIGFNYNASPNLTIDPIGSTLLNYSNAIKVQSVNTVNNNIALQELNQWALVDSSNGGTWKRSDEAYEANPSIPVWELSWNTANASHMYGFSIDAADYPALHNKLAVFSVNAKSSSGDVGFSIYINSAYVLSYPTTWTRKSVVFKFPTTGILTFKVRKQVAAGSIYVCAPVVTEFGSNILEQEGTFKEQTSFLGTAAPTVGTWELGDIVWNTEPSAGGPPGWVCVTAGTPGTWKAMANLAP